jgi:hypothetical protein
MNFRVLEPQSEVGLGARLITEEIATSSQADSVSGKIVYAIAGVAAAATAAGIMTPTSPSSAAWEAPTKRFLEKRIVNDTIVFSKGQSHVEESLVALHYQSARALNALNAKFEQLAAVVGVIASRTSHESDSSAAASSYADLDLETILDRACDSGVIEDSVLVLAEAAIASEDKFERLAGIRAIALQNPQRGKALIEAQLNTESSEVIKSALQGTLRAIA